ncbi:MAG: hypothetical protein LBU32_28145 [Clostridiales bacterium]|jgi:hypothetical protein|nr:hypothetical protein [Clostridiales bacterium]
MAKSLRRNSERFFQELHDTLCDLADWSDNCNSYFQTYIEKDMKDALSIQDESAIILSVKAVAQLIVEMLNLTATSEI